MAILADFLKTFDAVAYETVLKKMHKVGFSKSYLRWLSTWSSGCNLCLNPDKTKVMLFSTQQLARVHKLDEYPINLHTNGAKLERIKATRLLHRN
ncbi:hypothetical protein pdam_00015742, partial [Pocillopora damicornis]